MAKHCITLHINLKDDLIRKLWFAMNWSHCFSHNNNCCGGINLEFFMLLLCSWISCISNKLLSYENSIFGNFRNNLFLLIIIGKCKRILYHLFSWNCHLLVHFHLQCLHSEEKNGKVMKMKYVSGIIRLNDLKYGWKQFTKSQVSKGCNPKRTHYVFVWKLGTVI